MIEMPDHVVHRREVAKLGRVDGELKVGHGAKIEAVAGNLVTVSEGVYFDGSAEVDCDLVCETLRVEGGGALEVHGNLTVPKVTRCGTLHRSQRNDPAEEIDVGGKIHAKIVRGSKLRVGGRLEVEELLEVESVNVGGVVEFPERVVIKDLDVGGAVEIGGGKISGHVKVGGKFGSRFRLEFGEWMCSDTWSSPPEVRGQDFHPRASSMLLGILSAKRSRYWEKPRLTATASARVSKWKGSSIFPVRF